MPRQKKNQEAMSFRLDAEVASRFKAYADKLGQTYTLCLERILTEYLNDKMPDCDVHTCTKSEYYQQFGKDKGMGYL